MGLSLRTTAYVVVACALLRRGHGSAQVVAPTPTADPRGHRGGGARRPGRPPAPPRSPGSRARRAAAPRARCGPARCCACAGRRSRSADEVVFLGAEGDGRRHGRRDRASGARRRSTCACRSAPCAGRWRSSTATGALSVPSAAPVAVEAGAAGGGPVGRVRRPRAARLPTARRSRPRSRTSCTARAPVERRRRRGARGRRRRDRSTGTCRRWRRRRRSGVDLGRQSPAVVQPDGPLRVPRHRGGVLATRRRRRRQGADPAAFEFAHHRFPILGASKFGSGAPASAAGAGTRATTFARAARRWSPPRAAGRVRRLPRPRGQLPRDRQRRTATDYTYMHLRDVALVATGDRVVTGQPLGFVGDTGSRERAATCTSRSGPSRAGTPAARRSTRCRAALLGRRQLGRCVALRDAPDARRQASRDHVLERVLRRASRGSSRALRGRRRRAAAGRLAGAAPRRTGIVATGDARARPR